jgi:hypothetical protein
VHLQNILRVTLSNNNQSISEWIVNDMRLQKEKDSPITKECHEERREEMQVPELEYTLTTRFNLNKTGKFYGSHDEKYH